MLPPEKARMNPKRPSKTSVVAVNPPRTNLAEVMPDLQACQAWKGLVMVPKFCLRPDDWEAPRDMAMAV